MRTVSSTETQTDFLKAITVFKIIISNLKTDITDQSEKEQKKIENKKARKRENEKMFRVIQKCCLKKEES